MWRRSARRLLDLVVPAHCPTCDRVVADDGEFCAACYRRLRFVLDPCCAGCALPFASRDAAAPGLRCETCDAAPPPWTAARAAFVYDEASRRLVLPLKYADRTENALVLGRHMARAARALLDETDLLVPVPLHRLRLLKRRYNQSALLARAVRRAHGTRPTVLVDGLVRTRPTRRLARLGAAARLTEIADAIRPNPRRATSIDGARVVLVDDVLTTGATARACATALLDAGARSVGLLVAARTAPSPWSAD